MLYKTPNIEHKKHCLTTDIHFDDNFLLALSTIFQAIDLLLSQKSDNKIPSHFGNNKIIFFRSFFFSDSRPSSKKR